MNKYEELAELIFPNVTTTVEELESRYPSRNLGEDAKVVRLAPSPTGFLHTGSLFMTMINYIAAKKSDGVFYVRLEDTDQKREIAGSGESLINQIAAFGLAPSEGYLGASEKGAYGPYTQSKRQDIYDVVIKELIKQNKAYPCFCSAEELDEIRRTQEAMKVRTGYYGPYAIYHNIKPEEAIERIKNGEPYVIRFKSDGNENNHFKWKDEIKGEVDITENDQDIVIRKSDGLPTYHFAHLCDDHFMHTTHVVRGSEWLASLPIHIQLFKSVGWDVPKYCHAPVIMKVDENGTKRKLSKRHDKEAATSFFLEEGYPVEAFLEYLMTIANSNFEEWRIDNKDKDIFDFPFSFEKMSLDGALFDMGKLSFICKETLSRLSSKEFSQRVYDWAKNYDSEMVSIIEKDYDRFVVINNIEREKDNPRKDYEKYSDVKNAIKFFYNEYYDEMVKEELPFNPEKSKEDIINVLTKFKSVNDLTKSEEEWFASLKELAGECGFAANVKEYKKNKEAFKGHIGDVAEMIRIVMTCRKQTPNLYDILCVLGSEEVNRRLDIVINKIK